MQNVQTYVESLAPNGIYYRLYGKENPGAPIAMIMGYGACMLGWPLNFVGRLAEHSKVLIFDNRGTGRSLPLADDIELRLYHFAEDLKNLLAALGYEQGRIFGYSMGGCVALEFARAFPEFVECLILQSTTAGGALYTGSDQEVKDRMANPRGSNFDEMFFDFLDLCLPAGGVEKHKELLQHVCANARPYPTSPKVMQRQLKAFRNFDASEYVKTLNHPSLLFHGLDDRILKIRNGQMLCDNLQNCQGEFIEDCGHCPHIEHEDRVVARIQQFLS